MLLLSGSLSRWPGTNEHVADSAGDALIYSESIVTPGGLDRARPLMGVCPQFDTGLWELLTAEEHLTLFASIKGLPSSTRAAEVTKLLEDVKVQWHVCA